MSDLTRFLKKNKVPRENRQYAATKSLTDEKGKPLKWTLRPITTKENEKLREECTVEVQVKGKPNLFRPKVDTGKYIAKMIAAAVVEPNLYDKDLQDSYDVMNPEDLLKEMVDEPGEFSDFAEFVQKMNGFEAMDDKVKEAKN